ncbi:MAG: DMT family transporter [Candidatus Flexifilum sp.]
MSAVQDSAQGRSGAPVASDRGQTFKPSALVGFGYIALSVFGFSMLPVWTNLLLDAGMPPFSIAVWRFVIVAPVFWIAALVMNSARARVQAQPIRRLPRRGLMLLGSLYALSAVTAFFGLSYIPAGTFSVIFYTYPMIVALIGLVLGERLSLWGWIAVILTLIGVALTAPGFADGLRGENLAGVILALINAAVVALYFVISSRLLRGRVATLGGVMQAVAWTMTGTLIFILAVGAIVGIQTPQSWPEVLYLLALALFSTVMSLFAVNMGIQFAGPTRAAVFGTFEPLLTALMAFLFLRQEMQAIQWLGGVIVVISVVLLQTRGMQIHSAQDHDGTEDVQR